MTTLRTIAIRGVTLSLVLLAVLGLIVFTLGATGLSDKLLSSILNEQIRGLRQTLAQRIRDPAELEQAIQAQREEIEQAYGLDRPWFYRLPNLVWRVLTLDLGQSRTLRSFTGSSNVADIILERLPYTLILVTTALAISAAVGLLIGVKLATRVGSRLDRGVSYLSAFSSALPTWWTGILLILLLSFQLRLFPSSGIYSTPPPTEPIARALDLVMHSLLPILTLVVSSLGGWIYVTRTMVLNIAQEDFVTVARAKRLPERLVMRRHIIRVAAPPILTSIILGLAGSFGGAILTETVFSWPGMGRLYYDAVLSLDESMIVALTFVFTLLYVGARFLLEILYVALDPRVRL